ncbi:MAG: GH3 auxin-responsive promoter family protein [Atopobiaceae bacterium]|nr:GH3 auxin-responsive promoter family protein [Atopobiaceae bacterium]
MPISNTLRQVAVIKDIFDQTVAPTVAAVAQNQMNHIVSTVLKQRSYKVLHAVDESSREAEQVNLDLLFRLLEDNKDTEYGRKYNFADIHDVDAYREQVPLTTYEDYEDAITRMSEHDEKNLLTAYPVVYYASTSGTSGAPKKIPVSDKGLQVFREHSSSIFVSVVSEFYKNTMLKDMPDGYWLAMMNFAQTPLPNGTMFGSISAACLNDEALKAMPYFACTPLDVFACTESANFKYLHARYGLAQRNTTIVVGPYIPALLDLMNYIRDDWKMIVEDIRQGTINSEILMPDELRAKLEAELVPDPARADELEREFEKGFDQTIMRRIWPKLAGISSIWAGNFSSYARKLQEYSGRSIPYYTMSYVSSEGIFGVARHPHDQCYVMLPKSCFFEFIPVVNGKNDDEAPDAKTVLLNEVQEGKDYELVITNQSGFYRYRMGDVIRVIGFYNESPMVTFKYRKKNIVSIAGEKFTEDHLLSAVRSFERKTGINVIDFCMYPDRDAEPGRYVVLLEPEEVVPKERYDECQAIMAEELVRASTSYAHYVTGGNMGEPKLIFLQKETFQFHREMKMYEMGINENQLKPVRVLDKPELIRFFTLLEER